MIEELIPTINPTKQIVSSNENTYKAVHKETKRGKRIVKLVSINLTIGDKQ